MKIDERATRKERLLAVAQQMATAARTAPKARGLDIIEICIVTDNDIEALSKEMAQYGKSAGLAFFERDSANILSAEAVMLVGTRQQTLGLNCGYCGFDTCAEKIKTSPQTPCAFNSIDVGIAIGSACSVAADCRADTRVMYSVGKAAELLGWMPSCHQIIGIAIGCSSKNTFFDRK